MKYGVFTYVCMIYGQFTVHSRDGNDVVALKLTVQDIYYIIYT